MHITLSGGHVQMLETDPSGHPFLLPANIHLTEELADFGVAEKVELHLQP